MVETSRLVPFIVIIGILAAFALGLSVMTTFNQQTSYKELERENRLLQLKVDEFRMALMKAGINPNPHLEGESQ